MYKRISSKKDQEFIHAALSCIGDSVITTDVNGIIRYANHKVEDLIELDATELIGKILIRYLNLSMPIQNML